MRLEDIAQKEYFTIGDISKITGIPSHTLRYWENAFNLLRPLRKESKRRLYARADADTIFKIKDLVYKHKMTLEGAKRHLARYAAQGAKPKNPDNFHTTRDIKFLKEIKETLSELLKE
jgi:DNA-binding transcriptional MerR regulator